MAETKRHPQHSGGVWPLNVEYRNEPRITVMASHPADAEEAQAMAEAKAKAIRAREAASDAASAEDADAEKPAKKK